MDKKLFADNAYMEFEAAIEKSSTEQKSKKATVYIPRRIKDLTLEWVFVI